MKAPPLLQASPETINRVLVAKRRREEERRARISRYADNPVGFAHDILGFDCWSKQRETMESVRDHPRTAVRSCHGVGKTAAAAQVALWFLAVHENSRVITTAPTWTQIKQLLWREIRSAVTKAHDLGRGSIFAKPSETQLQLGEQWFAVGLSTNEPERFQGHHADHILLIVDEASGVDEGIFEAAEGFLTAEGAKALLIGNPTRLGGQFHRCFTGERARWEKIHISVYDSPNYTGEQVPERVRRSMPRASWAEEVKRAWGEESPMFQVRALGDFPDAAEDAVIPLHVIEAAQQRKCDAGEPVTIGCDVARFGDDETVIVIRQGQRVRIAESYIGKPTTHTAGRLALHASRFESAQIVVDDVGVGGGVTDQLRAEGLEVTAFAASGKPRRPNRFPNRRSEAWFEAAEALAEIDLDPDEQLAADLSAPRYSYDMKLRQVVESKEHTKARLGRSPDRADAVLLVLSAVPEARMLVAAGDVPKTPTSTDRAPSPSNLPPHLRRLHRRVVR